MTKKKNPVQEIFRWLRENILWDYGKQAFSLIMSLIVPKLNVFDFFPNYQWYIKYPLYFLLIYGFTQIIADIYNAFYGEKYLPIVKARTEGVYLRNEGTTIEDILDSKKWMEKFDEWDKSTIELISKFSKTEGEKFRVINRFKLTPGNIITHVPFHSIKYNVLEEKLARLETLLDTLERKD